MALHDIIVTESSCRIVIYLGFSDDDHGKEELKDISFNSLLIHSRSLLENKYPYNELPASLNNSPR